MIDKVNLIKDEFKKDILNINDIKKLNDVRVLYLGKNGKVTEVSKLMKDVAPEQKKEFGMLVNEVRSLVTNALDKKKEELELNELNNKLSKEAIDITLPATEINTGSASILEKVVEDFEEVFMSMGYDVVDGPELEEDRFNFELLGLPKGHPDRDAQDTFYVKGD